MSPPVPHMPVEHHRSRWVAMLVENDTYPQDIRVRNEALTLVAAGYRVTVVAPRAPGQPRSERLEDVEVRRFWLPRTRQTVAGLVWEYVVAHLQLTRLTISLLARGVQIVHLNNPPDTLSPLLVLARWFGRRTVFDNHDLFPELFTLRYGSGWLAAILRRFQRLAFRRADVVLTTNESQRERVLAAVPRAPESVLVVRNGPLQAQVGHRSGLRSRAIDQAAPLELLFLGALEPQDGVVVLAEVVELLVKRYGVPSRLTVVGEGSCRKELLSEARRRDVEQLISFTGRIPHGEVAARLERADICLDPAPCNELNHASTMIKVAEYMAAGKPIVTFDLRETRRTAGDGALYAPCGDVEAFAKLVAELAREPSRGRQLVQAAIARLPELVWERSTEVLLRAYARLST